MNFVLDIFIEVLPAKFNTSVAFDPVDHWLYDHYNPALFEPSEN